MIWLIRKYLSILANKPVQLEPYNPGWPIEFDKLKKVYVTILGGHITGVEHVGSTAIEGLVAKPVLDLDIIINSNDKFEQVKKNLIKTGYSFEGNKGIEGRYAFRQTSGKTPDVKQGETWMKHHLYVCLSDSLALKNHLLLRDILRMQPALKENYAALKLQLSVANKYSREKYVKGKTDFIISLLSANGLSSEEITIIKNQNK
jgi:GrpB-like predicted nucleotidyltransferase (UPF0157 family)